MKSTRSNRASNAIGFLRSELVHCEDMLQYLDDDNQVAGKNNLFDSDDIDIDVTNYKIKLKKCTKKNNQTNKLEEYVHQIFDTNSFYNPKMHPKNSHSVQFTQLPSKKLQMKKLIQVDCSELNDEIVSEVSSFCENENLTYNIDDNGYNTTKDYIRNSNILVKSPDYCKRSAAENKVKNSILT